MMLGKSSQGKVRPQLEQPQTREDLDEVLYERLLCVIEKQTKYPRNKMTRETVLQKDIGLDGNTAVELLEAIQAEFGVDFSNLNFEQHFHNLSGGGSARTAVTVGDLYKAASSKIWTEPSDAPCVRVPIAPMERFLGWCVILLFGFVGAWVLIVLLMQLFQSIRH
jgi:hypothetical protein